MGTDQGALADPVTRAALRRATAEVAGSIVLGAGGLSLVGFLLLATPGPTDGRTVALVNMGLATLLSAGLLVGGVRSGGRLVRARRLLRAHRWHPWVLKAAYPQRRTIAVAADEASEEHLIRLDRWGARLLGRHRRHLAIYVAGEDRWWVVTPAEGRRRVVLGRMDVPYRRFRLINPGAAPDRFDGPESRPSAAGSPGGAGW